MYNPKTYATHSASLTRGDSTNKVSVDKAQSLASYCGVSMEVDDHDAGQAEATLQYSTSRRRWKPPRNLVSLNDYMNRESVRRSVTSLPRTLSKPTVHHRLRKLVRRGLDLATPSHRMESMFDWAGVKESLQEEPYIHESSSFSSKSSVKTSMGLTEYALIFNRSSSYSDESYGKHYEYASWYHQNYPNRRIAGDSRTRRKIPSSKKTNSKLLKSDQPSIHSKATDDDTYTSKRLVGFGIPPEMYNANSTISEDSMVQFHGGYRRSWSNLELGSARQESKSKQTTCIEKSNGLDMDKTEILGYRDGGDSSYSYEADTDVCEPEDLNIYLSAQMQGVKYQILGFPVFGRPAYNTNWMDTVKIKKHHDQPT